jgi:HD-GYP domain-containing protein (c-di-GMP phosphodiesterase class II)
MSQGDAALSILPALLDTVVFERTGTHSFVLLAQPPAWLARFIVGVQPAQGAVVLHGRFPFLDNFLLDAGAAWEQSAAPLRSGAWVERDADGRDWALEATALSSGSRRLLLLQHLGKAYERQVAALQGARESMLRKEQLESDALRQNEQIRQREEEIALRLLTAIGIRDRESGAHVRRMGQYAQAVARELRWTAPQVDDIRIAAPMHDVGKIGIPDGILLKPALHTDAERQVMQMHTELGAALLAGSDNSMLQMAHDIALGHHECWDGSGYPHGRRADEIPLSARIVGVLDVYDAMVHARVYCAAVPEDDVVKLIRERSGRQFDPMVATVFLDLLPEIRRIRAMVAEDDVVKRSHA